MWKKRRAAADAFCGSRMTRYQRLAAILAPAILLGTMAFVLLRWRYLPAQIPIHYDFSGQVTGYGGRGNLLVMPIFGLIMDLTLEIVGWFPASWNCGVRLTVLNRARVYRLARDLMADLRLGMALAFVLLPWGMLLPHGLPGGLIVGLSVALVSVPVLRYALRVGRAR